MNPIDTSATDLLGYRIERDAAQADRWRVLAPDGGRVLAVLDGRPAAERYVVVRELRALESRPRHPAW